MQKKTNDSHTAREIAGQPAVWETLHRYLLDHPRIRPFAESVKKEKELEILLTGAGSSAFIGQIVRHSFSRHFGKPAHAAPTTSLVTHPGHDLDPGRPLLLVSFARSGNSPESIAAIDRIEALHANVRHLVVTCNPDGELARRLKDRPDSLVLVLPPESDDKGLAMTGSFTSMTIAALWFARFAWEHPGSGEAFARLVRCGERLLQSGTEMLRELAHSDFDRIVFLGSGPLLGMAEESHLKVQELSDGVVMGAFNSFLGLRHGPKAVVNGRTLVVCLFSPDEQVYRYERDLALELKREGSALATLGIYPREPEGEAVCDRMLVLGYPEEETEGEEAGRSLLYDLLLPLHVLPAQILGYYKSVQLGLNPDSPSRSGAISRVVKGVQIYS